MKYREEKVGRRKYREMGEINREARIQREDGSN
jgi:hypothetical protein